MTSPPRYPRGLIVVVPHGSLFRAFALVSRKVLCWGTGEEPEHAVASLDQFLDVNLEAAISTDVATRELLAAVN